LVSYNNTPRYHNPKEFDLNLHRRENIKYCFEIRFLGTLQKGISYSVELICKIVSRWFTYLHGAAWSM